MAKQTIKQVEEPSTDIVHFLDKLLRKEGSADLPNMTGFQKEIQEAKLRREEEQAAEKKAAFTEFYLDLLTTFDEKEKDLKTSMKAAQTEYKKGVIKLKVFQAAKDYADKTGNVFPLLKIIGDEAGIERIKEILGITDLDENIFKVPDTLIEDPSVQGT